MSDTVFELIKEHLPGMDGWCSVDKAYILTSLVIGLRPSVSVELGVFGGKSAIPIALGHKYNRCGKLIAVDPWSNEAATDGYSAENKEWWAKQDLERVMRGFLNKAAELDCAKYIDVRRAKSDDVEPPDGCTLLHIDGQHSMQALRDAQRFTVKMPIGSVTVVDDIAWVDGGPAAAVKHMLSTGWVQLYTIDTGAVFQRVKKGKQ